MPPAFGGKEDAPQSALKHYHQILSPIFFKKLHRLSFSDIYRLKLSKFITNKRFPVVIVAEKSLPVSPLRPCRCTLALLIRWHQRKNQRIWQSPTSSKRSKHLFFSQHSFKNIYMMSQSVLNPSMLHWCPVFCESRYCFKSSYQMLKRHEAHWTATFRWMQLPLPAAPFEK